MNTNTAAFFRERVLQGSPKWAADLIEVRDGDAADAAVHEATGRVREAVAHDELGIAYGAVDPADTRTKPVAVATDATGPFVLPTTTTVQDRSYPLTRDVFAYVNRQPSHGLQPAVREFLAYIWSREGQEDVARDGRYLPLTASLVQQQRARLP